jgi:hypothetical protein
VAQDTGGAKDAGPWIAAGKPEYTVLIDEKHLVSRLYNMVNVPTGVWINEHGQIVRPNEVAFVDDRFTIPAPAGQVFQRKAAHTFVDYTQHRIQRVGR